MRAPRSAIGTSARLDEEQQGCQSEPDPLQIDDRTMKDAVENASCTRVSRVEVKRRLELRECLAGIAVRALGDREVRLCNRVGRVEFECSFEVTSGTFRSSVRELDVPRGDVRRWCVRGELECGLGRSSRAAMLTRNGQRLGELGVTEALCGPFPTASLAS